MDRLVNRQRQCRRELRKAWFSARGLADSVTHWQCKGSWMGFYLVRAVVSYLFQLTGALSVYGFRPVMQFSGYFHCLAAYVRAAIAGSVYPFRGFGYYWSSSASTATNAWHLHFEGASYVCLNNNNRVNGFSVRCVAQNLRLSLLCSLLHVRTKVCSYLEGVGCYWCSSAYDAMYAWFLAFDWSYVCLSSGSRAYGFSVRCVAQNLRLSLRCSFLCAKMYTCRFLKGIGHYCSSSASSATYGWILYIEGVSYVSLYGGPRVSGFSVRCVAQHLRLSLLCSFLEREEYRFYMPRGVGRIGFETAGGAV